MGPDDTELADLTVLDDGKGHFPPPFPYVDGGWSAFVSECENIAAGTFEYEVEIDVQGDGSATEVTLGLSTALYNEEGSNGSPPTEVSVDLGAATVDVREKPAAPAPAGLAACESIPYEDPADDGGCSCSSPGAARSAAHVSLFDLIAAVI